MKPFNLFRFCFAIIVSSSFLAAGIQLSRQENDMGRFAGYQCLVLAMPMALSAVKLAADDDGEHTS